MAESGSQETGEGVNKEAPRLQGGVNPGVTSGMLQVSVSEDEE